jgi:hypothetical protein
MPYAIIPYKSRYAVITTSGVNAGHIHSKKGLPKKTAEAQMRALYAAEGSKKKK